MKLYHEQHSPNLADASRGLLTELFNLQRAIAWQPHVCSRGLDGPVRVRLTARYYATLHTGRGRQQCFHISSSACGVQKHGALHSISQIQLTLLYTGHFGSEACALGSTSPVLFPAAKPNHTSRAFCQAVDIDNCIQPRPHPKRSGSAQSPQTPLSIPVDKLRQSERCRHDVRCACKGEFFIAQCRNNSLIRSTHHICSWRGGGAYCLAALDKLATTRQIFLGFGWMAADVPVQLDYSFKT